MLIEWKMMLLIILAVSAVVGVVFYCRQPGERVVDVTGSTRRAFEKRLATFVSPFMLTAGCIYFVCWFFSGQVYVVSGQDQCVIYRSFGESSIETDERSIPIEWDWRLRGRWILVNNSPHTVVVQDVAYGNFKPGPSTYVAPGDVGKLTSQIDYFFANDRPPKKIEARGDRAMYHWLKILPYHSTNVTPSGIPKPTVVSTGAAP